MGHKTASWLTCKVLKAMENNSKILLIEENYRCCSVQDGNSYELDETTCGTKNSFSDVFQILPMQQLRKTRNNSILISWHKNIMSVFFAFILTGKNLLKRHSRTSYKRIHITWNRDCKRGGCYEYLSIWNSLRWSLWYNHVMRNDLCSFPGHFEPISLRGQIVWREEWAG